MEDKKVIMKGKNGYGVNKNLVEKGEGTFRSVQRVTQE